MDVVEIGQLTREARKAAGLRQDELAGASGVGLRFIVELEAGKPTLQAGKMLRVLKTLGLTVQVSGPSLR
jgi:y4mF family transcriptional regulator